jgi:hypothetical protein
MFCRHIVRVLLSHHAMLKASKKGTQQRVYKGVFSVVFIEELAVRPLYPLSGGLTRGHATCQFIPFDPFLPDGM